MKFYNGYTLLFAIFYCVLVTPQLLTAKNTLTAQEQNQTYDKVQALIKQADKFKKKDSKISNTLNNVHENEDNLDDDAAAEVASKTMSTGTKILIGVGAAGLMSAAIIWAVIVKQREAERRRQEETLRRPNLFDTTATTEILPIHHEQRYGQCPVCLENTNLEVLHCGGAVCRTCGMNHLQNQYDNNRPGFNMILCPCGCRGIMTRGDIQIITNNDVRMLGAYDRATAIDHQAAALDLEHMDPLTAEYIRRETRPCPHCHRVVLRTEGCNHMTCVCRYQFCYNCLGPYNGIGACPRCHVYLFGADANYHHDPAPAAAAPPALFAPGMDPWWARINP